MDQSIPKRNCFWVKIRLNFRTQSLYRSHLLRYVSCWSTDTRCHRQWRFNVKILRDARYRAICWDAALNTVFFMKFTRYSGFKYSYKPEEFEVLNDCHVVAAYFSAYPPVVRQLSSFKSTFRWLLPNIDGESRGHPLGSGYCFVTPQTNLERLFTGIFTGHNRDIPNRFGNEMYGRCQKCLLFCPEYPSLEEEESFQVTYQNKWLEMKRGFFNSENLPSILMKLLPSYAAIRKEVWSYHRVQTSSVEISSSQVSLLPCISRYTSTVNNCMKDASWRWDFSLCISEHRS